MQEQQAVLHAHQTRLRMPNQPLLLQVITAQRRNQATRAARVDAQSAELPDKLGLADFGTFTHCAPQFSHQNAAVNGSGSAKR